MDLIAFLAVLAAGVTLVCIGGVRPDALAAVAVGLAYVYAVWADRSRQPESGDERPARQPESGDERPARQSEDHRIP